ncbi:SNF2-related protein [Candidatus Magnetominusculus dajiuhuensis]|uniref:DEAD/DEAH box helicase n=1 Tax=Candidatus Magnetominusculus dajiuhuensis TaxID=3137712 RepID=UPI003B428C91
MVSFTKEFIKNNISDSTLTFERGLGIFRLGNYYLKEEDYEKKTFNYTVDGNYGEYDVRVAFDNGDVKYACNCPYHSDGCKHTVAVCLDIIGRMARHKSAGEAAEGSTTVHANDKYLSYDEVRELALSSRQKSAQTEKFKLIDGETYKGEHMLVNAKGKEYIVTLHDPEKGNGHCSCPDFNTNRLGTCKHLIYVHSSLKTRKDFKATIEKEKFPFVHIYWDSTEDKPRYFFDRQLPREFTGHFKPYFDEHGLYRKDDIIELNSLLEEVKDLRALRVDDYTLRRLDDAMNQKEMEGLRENYAADYGVVKVPLYPYQHVGVDFGLFKKSVIIADEMGLGKTLQAITLSCLKKSMFNFSKVLVVTPASLKEQWKREIERFTGEKAIVVAGNKKNRQEIYEHSTDYFTITNYEAVLRDILAINRYKPDIVILDEAQRIKNFETKTHEAIKSISHKQSIVLTGTPLENKLEDLYSIVQFADPALLTPLWIFAAEHFIMSADNRKNKILGYKGLDILHNKLKPLVIRRKKEEVIEDLPDQVSNNYYIDLSIEQREIHRGYLQALLPLLNKKFQTPMDARRIQEILMSMRMVCDSTYLIDRKTNISPKLVEMERILAEVVLENKRKAVVFSEWTTMTYLIGKMLSDMGIPFVEFTGKVPADKRRFLVDEFNDNPDCKVFLSTDAGSVGLNLQSADCVLNFELPWNPSRLNQRIGRVMRIGQKSKCVNVINLISKHSIEEKVFAGITLKQEVFDGVFEGSTDKVEFTREKKAEFINKIREMMGEEQIVLTREPSSTEDIPEATPHFLNPKAMGELNVSAEEEVSADSEMDGGITEIQENDENNIRDRNQLLMPPEKMEEVLENGVRFLSGLMEMSTGKPLIPNKDDKAITIDRKTGEVTMKFRLPVF